MELYVCVSQVEFQQRKQHSLRISRVPPCNNRVQLKVGEDAPTLHVPRCRHRHADATVAHILILPPFSNTLQQAHLVNVNQSALSVAIYMEYYRNFGACVPVQSDGEILKPCQIVQQTYYQICCMRIYRMDYILQLFHFCGDMHQPYLIMPTMWYLLYVSASILITY